MKKYTILFGAVCAVVLALGSTAKAVTMLDFGDSQELGQVLFGIPSGDAARTTYVNTMIGLPLGGSTTVTIGTHTNTVTRSNNDFGPLPTAVFALNGTSTTINLGTGLYSYLFAKYDGPNAGSEVWFVGNLSGIITIPAVGLAGQNYGLSGWTLFGPGSGGHVPDGGATAALLGLGLAGLAGLRAKFGKK